MLPALSVAVVVAVASLWMAVARPVAAATARGRAFAGRPNALSRSPFAAWIGLLASLHRHPALVQRCAAIERKLAVAGRPGGPISGAEFLAAAELAGGALALAFVLLLALLGALSLFGVLFAGALGAATTVLVVSWLRSEAADRCRAIARALPFFLDLGVMAVGAGASLRETMEIYRSSRPEDPLAQELAVVLNDLRMGRTLAEALLALRERVPVESFRVTLDAIVQGSAMGTAIGDVLGEQADVIRFQRSQAAERAAEELKVRLQPPVVLMMLAVFLLILGPAVLRVIESGIL